MAPFWTEFNSDTMGGVQCDEYSKSGSESISGSEYIFQEVANFINDLKPDRMSFNPAWMIVCGWNNTNKIISPQVYLLHNSMFPLVRSNERLSARMNLPPLPPTAMQVIAHAFAESHLF